MRLTASRTGFSFVGLLAIAAVLGWLVFMLIPAVRAMRVYAEYDAVKQQGRDIFVAATGANTEGGPLGLPSAWPSDADPLVFTNSTDYFRHLLGKKGDRSEWQGEASHRGGDKPLTVADNLWTVAKNVRDDMPDAFPVLVTRNVDAATLAARVADADAEREIGFTDEWKTPFGRKAFVVIRKGGAILTCRGKQSVYLGQTFDANIGTNGLPVRHALKYLTPTREVVPGGMGSP
jgi:hypothetical protein